MMNFKKTITTLMATVLLLQSIMPASLFANEDPSAVSFDTRLATMDITETYNNMVKDWKMWISSAAGLAARLYAVRMVGPSCELQVSTAKAARLLDSQTKNTADQSFSIDKTTSWVSNSATAHKVWDTLLSISPICREIFGNKQADPSADLLKLYEKFFATFFPGVDMDTVSQAASQSENPDEYLEGVLTQSQIQQVYRYLETKELPTKYCSLSSTDEQLYMQTKAQYVSATESNDAATAKIKFEAMNTIQSRVVCADWVAPEATLNPECTNKISILKSQIASLQSDPISYQKDISRIQKAIDVISQSSDCSIDTKRAQLWAVTKGDSKTKLTTDVLQFQSVTPTVIPNTVPQFCQSTASALNEQLNTASYFTVNKLIQTIKDIKPNLTQEKQSLATLIQALAVDQSATKAQQLGLSKPSSAMGNFLTVLEMTAQNILTNSAMYKIIDIFPLMEMYWSAIDNTSLWNTNSFTLLQEILDKGARFVRNESTQSFSEENKNTPWLRFLARANNSSQTNDLAIDIKQLSAYQITEETQETPYSTTVTSTAPTLSDLNVMYFGPKNGETTAYDNTRNNRLWYGVTPSKTTIISDANYRLLTTNKQYDSYLQAWSFPVEVIDINGTHIAVVADHKNSAVRYLDAGTYANGWMRIDVGQNGQASIFYQNDSVYPRVIDASASINGKLELALKGEVIWPEGFAPFVEENPQDGLTLQNNTTNVVSLYSAETTKTATSKQRRDMLPITISWNLFFSPNVLNFELNRIYNPANGTNTITFVATLIGGATCWVEIHGSITYLSDEYGIPAKSEENPVLSANFSLGSAAYKLEISSSDIDAIVQALSGDWEPDIIAIINENIVNNISVLGMSFGSIVATQDGVDVSYSDWTKEDLKSLVMPIVESMDLGRLGQFIDFASDDGDKNPVDPIDPNQEQAYVNNYAADQNFFTISFIGDSWSFVNPTVAPMLYVESCFDKCQNYKYPMDFSSDGEYTVTVPLDIYNKAISIYAEAQHNGYQISQQFM